MTEKNPAFEPQHDAALQGLATTMLELKDPTLLREQAFLAGAWQSADNAETAPVTDPDSGALVARVPMMGAAETRRAIGAAAVAQKDWRRAGVDR